MTSKNVPVSEQRSIWVKRHIGVWKQGERAFSGLCNEPSRLRPLGFSIGKRGFKVPRFRRSKIIQKDCVCVCVCVLRGYSFSAFF